VGTNADIILSLLSFLALKTCSQTYRYKVEQRDTDREGEVFPAEIGFTEGMKHSSSPGLW